MAFGKLFSRPPGQKHKLPKSMLGSSLTPPVRNDIQAPDFELVDGVKKSEAATQEPGFDPYNSGAFDRRNTWRRAMRR